MMEGMYRGVFYTLLLSGMIQYYSMTEQRFIKSNSLEPIKKAINKDLESIGEWK